MDVVAAPDKFRGSASASEVAAAIARGVRDAGGRCRELPLADGGEGMLDAFGGANRWSEVAGPLGSTVRAGWQLDDTGLAVIESAEACGLSLAGGAGGFDPVTATSRGVGQLIVQAAAAGARDILIGVGGTAVTDGGWGAVIELRSLPAGHQLSMTVCCDVRTTFLDAARIFGPQKGAGPDQVALLSRRLSRQAEDYAAQTGVDVRTLAGSGAAGGLAGGLAAMGAELVSGFDAVADYLRLDEAMARADLVITGEGRFDATSLQGKVVGGVWARAAAAGVPVLTVVGEQDASVTASNEILSITRHFGRERSWQDTTACVQELVRLRLSTADV